MKQSSDIHRLTSEVLTLKDLQGEGNAKLSALRKQLDEKEAHLHAAQQAAQAAQAAARSAGVRSSGGAILPR